MANKYNPFDPETSTVIRQIHPRITTLSVPFLRFGRVQIGGRGTVVRLADGDLAVFSPVALTGGIKAALDGLGGRVRYITAPDVEHHVYLDEWHAAFPEARILGPGELRSKREEGGNALPWFKLFYKPAAATAGPSSTAAAAAAAGTGPGSSGGGEAPGDAAGETRLRKHNEVDAAFDAEFDVEFVAAHPNKELVFNHRPTGTLIQADLMFNLPATEQMSKTGTSPTSGLLTKIFVAVNSAAGSALWQKRLIWYLMSRSDRDGYNASIRRIDAWKWDRMVPCHGDVIESGAKGVFRKVFEWHLAGQGTKRD